MEAEISWNVLRAFRMKNNCYWDYCLGLSNRHAQLIELHLISWQYSLINYPGAQFCARQSPSVFHNFFISCHCHDSQDNFHNRCHWHHALFYSVLFLKNQSQNVSKLKVLAHMGTYGPKYDWPSALAEWELELHSTCLEGQIESCLEGQFSEYDKQNS